MRHSDRASYLPMATAALSPAYNFDSLMPRTFFRLGQTEAHDQVQNGIALSPTYHRAFDAGLIYLNQNFEMRINEGQVHLLRNMDLAGGVDAFRQPLGRIFSRQIPTSVPHPSLSAERIAFARFPPENHPQTTVPLRSIGLTTVCQLLAALSLNYTYQSHSFAIFQGDNRPIRPERRSFTTLVRLTQS